MNLEADKWNKDLSGSLELGDETEVAGVERDGKLAGHTLPHLCVSQYF